MSDQPRHCPTCGHSLLGLTTSEEIASCPNCGKFFERYRAASVSRWPSLWKMGIVLCGPMVLVVLMRAGQWMASRSDQQVLYRVFEQAYAIGLPIAWVAWPLVGGFLMANRYASAADRWMSSLGVAIAAMVANTAVMLAALLVRLLV
jgi:hypothetical protein